MRRYYYNPVDNPNDGQDLQILATTAETAAVAELAYTEAGGKPRIEPLTPLPLDGAPAFALPYACTGLAHDLEESPQVSLTFSDSRRAYVGWTPLAVKGRVEVIPDPEGDLFTEKLLYWELRKFPPSRGLVGSLLLRRDNWWYVPRLIVRFTPTEKARPAAAVPGTSTAPWPAGMAETYPLPSCGWTTGTPKRSPSIRPRRRSYYRKIFRQHSTTTTSPCPTGN